MEVLGVSLSIVSSVDLQGVPLCPLRTVFENARMPDRPASCQSGTRMKKNADAGPSHLTSKVA
jgi:hypothetical protein